MKIALIEVSHWHWPLYEPALRRAGVQVVAVCDRNVACRERVARRLGARAHADARSLLEQHSPDFAFVFGRHKDMPQLGLALIERGVPFCIEKPGGVSAAEVRQLRVRAERRGLFVAVPFVQRVSALYATIRRLVDVEGASFGHSSWRFFAGPPDRYADGDNDWMLDPEQSGGGCLINLAPHFIDLALTLHGAWRPPLASRLSNRMHGTPVEDYAMLSMACGDGATTMIETGYCFPDPYAKREYSLSLASATHYVRSCADGIVVHRAGGAPPEFIAMDLDADPLYARFVERVLDDVHAARAPIAGLGELEAVMRVVDAARASQSR